MIELIFTCNCFSAFFLLCELHIICLNKLWNFLLFKWSYKNGWCKIIRAEYYMIDWTWGWGHVLLRITYRMLVLYDGDGYTIFFDLNLPSHCAQNRNYFYCKWSTCPSYRIQLATGRKVHTYYSNECHPNCSIKCIIKL